MEKEIKKKLTSNWFKLLQNIICEDIEKIENKKIKFKSKKFFFDAEIMIIFYLLNKKMKYIPVEYSIPKDSTIKIFEFKNFLYLYELLKVIIYYKLVSKKKYTTLV